MSGAKSRNKGRRLEQEVVNFFKDHGFMNAKRISMLETGGVDKGDVKVDALTLEVKGGAQVPKFIYEAVKSEDHILVMRRDRMQWKICMDLERFIEMSK